MSLVAWDPEKGDIDVGVGRKKFSGAIDVDTDGSSLMMSAARQVF